jgi:hypothetical protein
LRSFLLNTSENPTKKGKNPLVSYLEKLLILLSKQISIMRSYRPLILIPLSILLVILLGITSFVMPKKEIIGAWVSQSNPEYKIEFLQNGTGKDYYANKENKQYHYTIATQCDEYSAYRSLFVKITDDQGNSSACYELKEVNEGNDGILVFIDMEDNEEYLYTRVD